MSRDFFFKIFIIFLLFPESINHNNGIIINYCLRLNRSRAFRPMGMEIGLEVFKVGPAPLFDFS